MHSKTISKISLVALLLLGYANLSAAPVSLQRAQTVALNWMNQATGKHFTLKNPDKQLSSFAGKSNSLFHSSSYRIIMLEPKGWVIVSSDDVAKPIIAYGESDLDPSHVPPQFEAWMKGVDRKISSAIKAAKSPDSPAKLGSHISSFADKWKQLEQATINTQEKALGSSDKKLGIGGEYIVKPLLWIGGDSEDSGIRWDQGQYYNSKCPADPNAPDELDGHVYVGCVATAVGQALRYYESPTVGVGSHEYYDATYDRQYADFGNTVYDWDNMPYQLDQYSADDEINAVATLLYHIGVAVEMEYSINGSIAGYIGDNGAGAALRNYFRFPDATAELRSYYSDTLWNKIIQTSLDNGDPVLYGGLDPYYPNYGHAFVLDGYTTDGYYHFNWGWSGTANGNFLLNDLTPTAYGQDYDFSADQRAVFIKGTYGYKPDQQPQEIYYQDNDYDTDSASINLVALLLVQFLGMISLYIRRFYSF